MLLHHLIAEMLGASKEESALMTVFDQFTLKVVACAGLCGAAIALSPDAAATPLKTGGYECVQGMAGQAAAPAAGGPAATNEVCTASLTDMSGVPLVVPGPAPALPAGAPLIALGPPVPAVAP
ncbi:beta-xylosidase, partial [Mycobacterium simiae]